MPDQPVEELLEKVWTIEEEGKGATIDALRSAVPVDAFDENLMKMAADGLLAREADQVKLTAAGRDLAGGIVRRHRLAERLLTDVLDVGSAETESSACQFEHCLSEEVTDRICTLLGHPATCPHGKPIPPGLCCRRDEKAPTPIVVRLCDLDIGQQGRLAYICTHRDHGLDRLTSLGLLPGALVRLEQKSPSTVVTVGETTLALSAAIAREIFVRPFGEPQRRRRRMGPTRRFFRRRGWQREDSE